jgi:hypothetical protein
MARKSWVALWAIAGFMCAVQPSFGCGDKLVLLGRGIRFQRMLASRHPGSILVYLNPAAGIAAADREYQLRSLLKLAGHKPRTVSTIDEVMKEIGSGTYDLLLADYADAALLEKRIAAARARPSIIPVIYNPSSEQRAAVAREYSCLVAPSKKNYDLLKVIDEAMATRSNGSGAKCQKIQV